MQPGFVFPTSICLHMFLSCGVLVGAQRAWCPVLDQGCPAGEDLLYAGSIGYRLVFYRYQDSSPFPDEFCSPAGVMNIGIIRL